MQDFKMSGSNMNELLTNMKAIKERIDEIGRASCRERV